MMRFDHVWLWTDNSMLGARSMCSRKKSESNGACYEIVEVPRHQAIQVVGLPWGQDTDLVIPFEHVALLELEDGGTDGWEPGPPLIPLPVTVEAISTRESNFKLAPGVGSSVRAGPDVHLQLLGAEGCAAYVRAALKAPLAALSRPVEVGVRPGSASVTMQDEVGRPVEPMWPLPGWPTVKSIVTEVPASLRGEIQSVSRVEAPLVMDRRGLRTIWRNRAYLLVRQSIGYVKLETGNFLFPIERVNITLKQGAEDHG